jgi:hypothetical protein
MPAGAARPWLCWLWLGLGGCGSPDVFVGGGPASEGGRELVDDGVGSDRATWTPLAQPTAFIEGVPPDSPWLGRWGGELRASSPRPLVIELRYSEEAQGAVGSVTFGQGPPPPEAHDPLIGYPQPADMRHEPGLFHHAEPADGFAYTILAGRLDGSVLRFAISLNQLWSDWCGLQPDSYFHRVLGRYGCVPEGQAVGPDNQCVAGGYQVVDCDRMELCSSFSVCVCWPNDCAADLSLVEQLELVLDSGGSSAGGTASIDDSGIQLSKL